jgi:hypothetical protein
MTITINQPQVSDHTRIKSHITNNEVQLKELGTRKEHKHRQMKAQQKRNACARPLQIPDNILIELFSPFGIKTPKRGNERCYTSQQVTRRCPRRCPHRKDLHHHP